MENKIETNYESFAIYYGDDTERAIAAFDFSIIDNQSRDITVPIVTFFQNLFKEEFVRIEKGQTPLEYIKNNRYSFLHFFIVSKNKSGQEMKREFIIQNFPVYNESNYHEKNR